MAETSQTEQKRPIRRRKGPASFRTQAERLCQWVPPSLPIDPNGFTAGGYPFGPSEPPFCQRQLHATVDPMKTPPTLRPSKRRFFIPLALTAATALLFGFRAILRGGKVTTLHRWMEQARNTGIHSLVRFVRTSKQDLSAVEAAVSEPWSNGPVEGQLNRLKMLKRQMYGRAGIELLRARQGTSA